MQGKEREVMKSQTVESSIIDGVAGLDPITVFWEDVAPGKGNVTIHCYGEAWTAWFGGMGNRTIKQFFSEVGSDYMASKLHGAQFQKRTKAHEKYLTHIVKAIQVALIESTI